MKLSIIIPAFNEEKTINIVIKKLFDLNLSLIEKEIIIVNDGSTDNTSEKLKSLEKYKNISIFHNKKNMGKGKSVILGIEKAKGDYIIIQDADLEYDPAYIPRLLQPIIEKKADIIYGTRLQRLPNLQKEEKTFQFFLHYFGNRILSLITSLLYGSWITDMETGYKVFPKSALKGVTLHAKGFEFEPEITAKLLKKGYSILEIPITTNPRGYKEGKKLNTFSDGKKALVALVKYRFTD